MGGGAEGKTNEDVHAWVTEYYGKILKESKDLKTNVSIEKQFENEFV